MAREAAIMASQSEVAAMRAELEHMGSTRSRETTGVASSSRVKLERASPVRVRRSGEFIDLTDD